MQNELIKKQKLESILGQLLDLKQGMQGEIVLRNNEWTDLIRECVADKISEINNFLEMAKKEEIVEELSEKMKEEKAKEYIGENIPLEEIAQELEMSIDDVKEIVGKQEAKIDIDDVSDEDMARAEADAVDLKIDRDKEERLCPEPTGL